VISNYAVGVDNIDLGAATERGIPVGFTPDVLTEATADATFALLLAAARRVVEGDEIVRAGRWLTWEPTLLLGQDVHGKTLGIIGMGRIGTAVARRAEGFGMEVLWRTSSDGTPLDELLERSDFVSLHAPLTPETRALIDDEQLKAMKPTAILVNTSRGGLVDSGALARALANGWIAGAALDVADPEPIPHGHPLLDAPNLILNPHTASASIEARTAMADLAVENLLAGLAGEPMPQCFNADALGVTRQAP
jgi:glyoxylate reductase